MSKRVVLFFTLLTLTACLLSYRVGSAPTALAKAKTAPQEDAGAGQSPLLPAPPNEWVLTSFQVNPAVAAVTKTGVAGVQHVADCISAAASSASAGGSQLELLDGNTVVMQWVFGMPTLSTGMGQVSICGLNVVGGVGNNMTLKFTTTITGGEESVNLVGHDAT